MSDWNAAFSVGEVQKFSVSTDPFEHSDGSKFLFTVCVKTIAGEHYAVRVASLQRVIELIEEFQPQEIGATGSDADLIMAALVPTASATLH